jgi:hypothetical protein
MISSIGPCSLEELPQPYQDAFLAGNIHQQKGTFVPMGNNLFSQIFLTLIMFPMVLVPAMMVIFLNYFLFFKPFEIVAFVEKIFSQSWGVIVVTIILIAIIVALMVYMGKIGYNLVKDIILSRQEKRNRDKNAHHFGLLLHADHLVARLQPEDGQEKCLFIPRKNIEKVAREYVKANSDSSRMVFKIVIHYQTDDEKKWYHVFNHHSLRGSQSEIFTQLKQWAGYGKY